MSDVDESFVLVTEAFQPNGEKVRHVYGPLTESRARVERRKALKAAERNGYELLVGMHKMISVEGEWT